MLFRGAFRRPLVASLQESLESESKSMDFVQERARAMKRALIIILLFYSAASYESEPLLR